MPTYEYPGVYVEEIGGGVHEIPGVDPPIDPSRLQSLVSLMRELAPSWANFNESDPGVTLVQLFSWLSEQLLYRANEIPERHRDAIRRALVTLSTWPTACPARDAPLRRPNFFSGRMLDAAALQQEQCYHREKLRRHNLALHGFGVVSGLDVRVDETTGGSSANVVIDPGHAIAPYGDEVSLPRRVITAVAIAGESAYVTLRPWDRPCDDRAPSSEGSLDPLCIEEACVIAVAADIPKGALAVARLRRADHAWSVDATYEPARAR